MDYEVGYCIIITMVIILLIRTFCSKGRICPHSMDKPIIIKCKKGAKSITVDKLITIFDKFGINIKRCIHVVDENNCGPFSIVVKKSICSLEKWMSVQNDPLFINTMLEQNGQFDAINSGEMGEEKMSLDEQINTLSEITSSSKSDENDPIEDTQDPSSVFYKKLEFDDMGSATPVKTKNKMISFINNLRMIINILASVRQQNDKISYAEHMLDITEMEELMKLLEYATSITNTSNISYNLPMQSKNITHHSDPRRMVYMNIPINASKSNSVSDIVAKKSTNKKSCFPQLINGFSIKNNRNNIIL